MNCVSSRYCCKRRYINDTNVSLRSCVGETCHSSLDCGGPDEYCAHDNTCRKSCSTDLNAVFPGSVLLSVAQIHHVSQVRFAVFPSFAATMFVRVVASARNAEMIPTVEDLTSSVTRTRQDVNNLISLLCSLGVERLFQ